MEAAQEGSRLCRQHLLEHEDPRVRPEPWDAFLEEWVHGPHIVRFVLTHFEGRVLCKFVESVLVTHSRFDDEVQDPGANLGQA